MLALITGQILRIKGDARQEAVGQVRRLHGWIWVYVGLRGGALPQKRAALSGNVAVQPEQSSSSSEQAGRSITEIQGTATTGRGARRPEQSR